MALEPRPGFHRGLRVVFSYSGFHEGVAGEEDSNKHGEQGR
jgi:hypothetical protein